MKRLATTISLMLALAAAQVLRAQEGRTPVEPPQPRTSTEPEPAVVVTPEERAEYVARDLEGRWVYLTARGLENARVADAWAGVLAEQRDFELMELVALYGPLNAVSPVRKLLFDADAPQSLRVAAWQLGFGDSHQRSGADKALRERAETVLDWLERHPDARTGFVAKLYEELAATHAARRDSSRYLPPLDDEEVFAELRRAGERRYTDFGGRGRARPGESYLHQIQRAIEGLNRRPPSSEKVHGWLERLVHHDQAEVRRAAILAYSHFGYRAPIEALWSVVQDDGEDAGLREAALLSLSYGPDAVVYARLVAVALDPRHAAWPAAISRLADVDRGYLLTLDLRAPPAHAALLDHAVARVRGRSQAWSAETALELARSVLERAAVAELEGQPFAVSLADWTTGALRGLKDQRLAALLDALHTSYSPAEPLASRDDRVELTALVRGLARRSR